jgi:hypothetical protein
MDKFDVIIDLKQYGYIEAETPLILHEWIDNPFLPVIQFHIDKFV